MQLDNSRSSPCEGTFLAIPSVAKRSRREQRNTASERGVWRREFYWDPTFELFDLWKLRTLQGHSGQVAAIAISPDGSRIVSGAYDNSIRIWDAANSNLLRILKGSKPCVRSGYRPTATGSSPAALTVSIWDAASGKLLLTLQGHSKSVRAIAFTLTGSGRSRPRRTAAASSPAAATSRSTSRTPPAATFCAPCRGTRGR
jgi:WD40 repeat protein